MSHFGLIRNYIFTISFCLSLSFSLFIYLFIIISISFSFASRPIIVLCAQRNRKSTLLNFARANYMPEASPTN